MLNIRGWYPGKNLGRPPPAGHRIPGEVTTINEYREDVQLRRIAGQLESLMGRVSNPEISARLKTALDNVQQALYMLEAH